MNSGESSQVDELKFEIPQCQHAEERLRRRRQAAVVLIASYRAIAAADRTVYVRRAGFGSTAGGSGLGVRDTDIGAASYTNDEQGTRTSNQLMIACPLLLDDSIVSEAHPGSVGGGRVDVAVEPNDGTMLGPHVSDGALVHVRVGGKPYAYTIPPAGAGHLRSDISGGSGASSGFAVRGGDDALGAELNDMLIERLRPTKWGDLRAGGSGSIASFPSSPPFNGITSAQAIEAELNDMLPSPRSTTRARGHGGSQSVFVDETGGRFLVIHINTQQQGNRGLVAAARGPQDGPADLAQRALQSVFGGLVPLCLTLLLDDNILNGASPGYIKAATCAGLGLVTGFTYLGLLSKKRAKAAVRVMASTAMAAVSIALVYTVSDNVYIKCTCGTIGAIATVATMAIV